VLAAPTQAPLVPLDHALRERFTHAVKLCSARCVLEARQPRLAGWAAGAVWDDQAAARGVRTYVARAELERYDRRAKTTDAGQRDYQVKPASAAYRYVQVVLPAQLHMETPRRQTMSSERRW
jgi:hypothetical protein